MPGDLSWVITGVETQMKKEKNQTYDFVCFTDLVYEFSTARDKAIEQKIKRRLKYHRLGEYNQERVDYLRQLKNHLHTEIAKAEKSVYFNKSESPYTELKDFDLEKMSADYHSEYNTLDKDELTAMIQFAIYLYYTR